MSAKCRGLARGSDGDELSAMQVRLVLMALVGALRKSRIGRGSAVRSHKRKDRLRRVPGTGPPPAQVESWLHRTRARLSDKTASADSPSRDEETAKGGQPGRQSAVEDRWIRK